jgi:toxin-antitoxin system PIN domain toxin
MSVFLLDTNVLIALAWPSHTAHASAQHWFDTHGPNGWATCPITQGGFVRVLSNPAVSVHALSVPEALQLLRINLRHPAHRFLADKIDLLAAVKGVGARLTGHQQITDAYLLGLAMHHGAKLATLDRGLLSWGGSRDVELIRSQRE